MLISSPASISLAARTTIVSPHTSVLALGAHEWLISAKPGHKPIHERYTD